MPHYFVSPSEQYSARLRERELRLARLDRMHVRMGSARLAIGASFLAAAGFASASGGLRPAGFWFRSWHSSRRCCITIAFGNRGPARSAPWRFTALGSNACAINGAAARPNGERFDDPHHIYASDLDLFGADSLYELLCAARTQMGENTLAQWLLAPADIETIRARHAAIADLRTRLDLHEDLAIGGEPSKIALHPEMLIAWARAPNRLNHRWIRWTAPLLAVLAMAAAAVWAIWGISFPLLAVLMIEVAVGYYLKKPIREAIVAVESAYEDLKGLSAAAEPHRSGALRCAAAARPAAQIVVAYVVGIGDLRASSPPSSISSRRAAIRSWRRSCC